MKEGEEMKDLDRLVAEAKIDGIKNDNNNINPGAPAEDLPIGIMSSSVGVGEIHQSVPKIRTYSDDAQKAVESSNAQATRVSMSKHKQKYSTERNSLGGVFITIILLLGIIALVGVYFAYVHEPKEEVVVETEVVKKETIISYDEIIDSKNDPIHASFQNVSLDNGITYIFNETLSVENITEEYFKNIPSVLERNLSSKYMAGVVSSNSTHSPFIILNSSYKFVLPGMQLWEQSLSSDLSSLFSITDLTRETYLDIPHPEHIIRTNELVTYAITKNGELIISNEPATILKVLEEL
jgi:hypothetical protein